MKFVLYVLLMLAAMFCVAIVLDIPQPAGCIQVRFASVCR